MARRIVEKVKDYARNWKAWYGEARKGNEPGKYLKTPGNWLRDSHDDGLFDERREVSQEDRVSWQERGQEHTAGYPRGAAGGIPGERQRVSQGSYELLHLTPPENSTTIRSADADFHGVTSDSEGETAGGSPSPEVVPPPSEGSPARAFPGASCQAARAPAPATAIEDDPLVQSLDPELRKVYDRWVSRPSCSECGQAPAESGSQFCYHCRRVFEG